MISRRGFLGSLGGLPLVASVSLSEAKPVRKFHLGQLVFWVAHDGGKFPCFVANKGPRKMERDYKEYCYYTVSEHSGYSSPESQLVACTDAEAVQYLMQRWGTSEAAARHGIEAGRKLARDIIRIHRRNRREEKNA